MSTPSAPAQAPALTAFEAAHFRRCLGEYVTGVTVITTVGPDGERYGLTANSFSSLSLDPPLILWSLRLNATNFSIYSQATHFAVNILADHQVDVANRFAKSGPNRFDGIDHALGADGMPLIAGSVAQLECVLDASHPGGDHLIFIGRVQRLHHIGHHSGDLPLAFRGGRYMALQAHPGAA
ncbi:MAG: flavin reductase family protein [Burkholderiales bacterium]